jgi:hypothetical protein
MLYREIIAVCSQIHTKHINTLCGLNVGLLNVQPVCTYGKSRFKTLFESFIESCRMWRRRNALRQSAIYSLRSYEFMTSQATQQTSGWIMVRSCWRQSKSNTVLYARFGRRKIFPIFFTFFHFTPCLRQIGSYINNPSINLKKKKSITSS